MKTIPSPYNFTKSARYVRHEMVQLAQTLKDNGYDLNWDQVHSIRIKAAGLARHNLNTKIRYARSKEKPYNYLMWLIIHGN